MNKEVKKVDFLEDLNKIIDALASYNTPERKILQIKLYTKSKEEDTYLLERKYNSLEELIKEFNPSEYPYINNISALYQNKDKTTIGIHMDKEKSSLTVLNIGKEKEESNKEELEQILKESEPIKDFEKEEDCTYYQFNNNKVGKYDPKTTSYYILNEEGKWEISGAVMRWVIDSAYDYVILSAPKQYKNKS